MDGWMDGLVGGWGVGGWVDGWLDGWMDSWPIYNPISQKGKCSKKCTWCQTDMDVAVSPAPTILTPGQPALALTL